MVRLTFLIVTVALLASAAAVSTPPPVPTDVDAVGAIDAALGRATVFLQREQDPDGAWRSDVYGALRDGTTLTGPILKTLLMSPGGASAESCQRAARHLRDIIAPDGTLRDGRLLAYPVYTASLAVLTLGRMPGEENLAARNAWIVFLRSHQLTESLGWSPADTAYGGWGYAVRPPRKPAGPGRPPFDADLSSTLFAVGALRCAGVPADDPAIRAARRFVEHCQNFAPSDADADADLDDGGFFLTPTNPGQNKAGARGTDRAGRLRYASYGSATADGLRALLRCGLDADHPRVQAARRWLERNFDAETNPGVFAPARAADRDGPYFYWCWSVAHALRACGTKTIERDGVTIDWASELSSALIRRQRADGSWANPISFTKEDDPLIATPLAAAALANCRLLGLGKREVLVAQVVVGHVDGARR